MGAQEPATGDRRAGSPRALRAFVGAVGVALLALVGTKVLLPAYFAPPSSVEKEAALNFAFTEVGTALEAWKSRHGSYPERLEQLVPDDLAELPVDPWASDGANLRYLVRGQGAGTSAGAVVLYSVGENGVDDGGRSDVDGSGNGDRLYPVW